MFEPQSKGRRRGCCGERLREWISHAQHSPPLLPAPFACCRGVWEGGCRVGWVYEENVLSTQGRSVVARRVCSCLSLLALLTTATGHTHDHHHWHRLPQGKKSFLCLCCVRLGVNWARNTREKVCFCNVHRRKRGREGEGVGV